MHGKAACSHNCSWYWLVFGSIQGPLWLVLPKAWLEPLYATTEDQNGRVTTLQSSSAYLQHKDNAMLACCCAAPASQFAALLC